MKRQPDTDFAAFVGIDWADAKHDICLQPADHGEREFSVLVHRPETIEEWALGLARRFAERPIAVGVELDKGPLVYALQKYPFFVLFPINPATLAKYRQAFTPSGAKDDPTDAQLALESSNNASPPSAPRSRSRRTAPSSRPSGYSSKP